MGLWRKYDFIQKTINMNFLMKMEQNEDALFVKIQKLKKIRLMKMWLNEDALFVSSRD